MKERGVFGEVDELDQGNFYIYQKRRSELQDAVSETMMNSV